MTSEKPDLKGYGKWLADSHSSEVTNRTREQYKAVTTRIKLDLEGSPFWIEVLSSLAEFNAEYKIKTDYDLLVLHQSPEVLVKPYESTYEKSYRKNVVQNHKWPDSPDGGWVLPSNWWFRLNDIVRTLIVVKYMDGVEFMVQKLYDVASKFSLPSRFDYEAKEEGYYAAHLYSTMSFEVPKVNWDTEKINVLFEIQITTQVQEVIRNLLHRYYENRRTGTRNETQKWQWDYRGKEFSANYLGHILHYLDGMIMEVRDGRQ